jgi:2-oxoglutarate ferredoxin oxidoreductase subunit beta
MKITEFNTPCTPNWCPGCGDFGIWSAIKRAVSNKGWKASDFVMVYGIGCHGHMVNFLHSYAVETLHGRPIPVAQGIKLANNKLNVVILAGDGDTFGEGTNHLVHASRRNMDLTMILHDNQVYGLTTGQTAPTAQKGFKSKSTPHGVLEEAVNPLSIVLAAGATFVARGFDCHAKS